MGKKKPNKVPPKFDFDEAVLEIQDIVNQLESGELGLSDSLERYERAVNRLKQCHSLLDAAELRVNVLSGFDADGNPITTDIETTQKKPSTGKKGRKRPLSDLDDDINVDDPPGLF